MLIWLDSPHCRINYKMKKKGFLTVLQKECTIEKKNLILNTVFQLSEFYLHRSSQIKRTLFIGAEIVFLDLSEFAN